MSPTAVSTDKKIYQELQFTYGGNKYFAYCADETAIANQVAAGAENVGPRWSLWTESAEGRIPIYLYSRTVDASRSLYDTAFQTTNTWTSSGFERQNDGQPIGYATTEPNAQSDALPMLMATGSNGRNAYTQWPYEMDLFVSQNGMTQQETTWSAPMMCQVNATFDASTSEVNLTSNDPDSARAADAEVNVYRGNGTAIRFYNLGAGEFVGDAISITYDGGAKNGRSAIGADEAFQPCSVRFSNDIWLTTDDEQTSADQEFKYSVTVVVDGTSYTHDPKIIQRKTQLVD